MWNKKKKCGQFGTQSKWVENIPATTAKTRSSAATRNTKIHFHQCGSTKTNCGVPWRSICLPHKQRPGQTGWDWAGFGGGGVCTPTSWTLRKAAPGGLLFTGSFSLPLLRDVEKQRGGGQVKKELQQCTRQVETGWKLKEGESGRDVLPEVEGEDVADRQKERQWWSRNSMLVFIFLWINTRIYCCKMNFQQNTGSIIPTDSTKPRPCVSQQWCPVKANVWRRNAACWVSWLVAGEKSPLLEVFTSCLT